MTRKGQPGKATHGDTRRGAPHAPEYMSWRAMVERCTNAKSISFPNYGGRGITVCERWLTYANFLADMGRKLTPKHTIDRIDSNGNYCPENCRWADRATQNRNSRRNVRFTLGERTATLAEWAREIGIHQVTLRQRVREWGLEKALTTPKQKPWEVARP